MTQKLIRGFTFGFGVAFSLTALLILLGCAKEKEDTAPEPVSQSYPYTIYRDTVTTTKESMPQPVTYRTYSDSADSTTETEEPVAIEEIRWYELKQLYR